MIFKYIDKAINIIISITPNYNMSDQVSDGYLQIFCIQDYKNADAYGERDDVTHLIWHIDMDPPREFIDLYPNLKSFCGRFGIKSLDGLSGSQLIHIDLMGSPIKSLLGVPKSIESIISSGCLESLEGIEDCLELNFLNVPEISTIDDPRYLSNCTKLVTLYVPNTEIKDISCLCGLVNLKNLAVPAGTIIPQEIRDLPGIKINQSTGISTM